MRDIAEIKRLLDYLPNDEMEIVDDECVKFFEKFINSRRGDDAACGVVTIGLYLASVATNPALFLEYNYYISVGDYDSEILIFDDKNANYNNRGLWMFGGRDKLNYSDIPDNIWEKIENLIYTEAEKSLRKSVSDGERHLKLAKGRLGEFEKLYKNDKKTD